MRVRDVPKDCDFVSDSIEVKSINSQVDGGACFDSYFIQQRDGEITAAYGMFGIVPYNERTVYSVGHLLP